MAAQTPVLLEQIANVCNEAALIAARKDRAEVGLQRFSRCYWPCDWRLGEENKIISPEEKKIVAYHEAGHAVAGWYLEHADPLVKVSIVPRGVAALGYAQYLPKEQFLYQTDQLFDEMCMALVAAWEDIVFKKFLPVHWAIWNASPKWRTALLPCMAWTKRLETLSFYDSKQSEYNFPKAIPDATAEKIDMEVKKVITACYDRTKELLNHHRENQVIAKRTVEKEILSKVTRAFTWQTTFAHQTTYQKFTNGQDKEETKKRNPSPKLPAEPTAENNNRAPKGAFLEHLIAMKTISVEKNFNAVAFMRKQHKE